MSQSATISPVIPRGFHVLRFALGWLLLTAAGFKAYALWIDPMPTVSLFSSPRWQIAFIELEVLLGPWLLTGLYARGAWLAALVLFTLLAGVSLYLGLIGSPSCGCFGRVRVNPWYTFALDVTAIGALVWYRPRPLALRAWAAGLSLRPSVYVASGVLVFLGLGFGALYGLDSSVSAALASLRGESLTVEPAVSDVGRGVPDEWREFQVQVRNHTDHPVRLIGGTADCSCVATDDLPLTLAPRESRTIKVSCKFWGKPRPFQQPFVLYTDDEKQFTVLARVEGEVVESREP